MPAVARREQHEKVRPQTGVLSRASRQGAHSPAARRAPHRRHEEPVADERLDEEMPHSAREYLEEMRDDAHPDVAPRRRIRRAHRDLRFSPAIAFAGALLFSQLLWLIWVKSLASAASHQTNKLDARIAQMQDDIARSQKKISATTSTVQLEAWSKQLNLRLATQADIDPVSRETKPRDYDAARNQNAIIVTQTNHNEGHAR